MSAVPDVVVLRKARGAFFTPPDVARFIAGWAIRTPGDRVLEPSCGDAAVLRAAADRLAELGGDRHGARLHGVEMHGPSAEEARLRLASSADGGAADIRIADFFTLDPDPRFDAVIGNPPYIRYQDFSGEQRARSRAAALRAGVALSRLASSWAAFTVHSASFLRPGGRLALVLPAELLTVNYAAGVRSFLMEHFSGVRLVVFEERVFPGVQEEVVLLLADGYSPGPGGGTDHCELVQARNAADLAADLAATIWRPAGAASKWTASVLQPAGLDAYRDAVAAPSFAELEDWGQTTLGMVTGNNRYFALSPQRVAELGLQRSDLIPISPPGSRHLRQLSFTAAARRQLGQDGAATWLLRPGRPSPAAAAYIAAGEADGVHLAYKCKVRSPWWRVPCLDPADILLTYMNADTPMLCANQAGAHHLNSVHGIYLDPGLRQLGRQLLPLAALNSVTMLGAEIVGRAYGGGILKLEPREADRLPVPSPALVSEHARRLAAVRGRVIRLLRGGRLGEAARAVDDVLFADSGLISGAALAEVRNARIGLAARRSARGRESRS